jgi:hypothetical protein
MGPTHRMFGALCGAAWATAAGMPTAQAAAVAALATATSSGPSSPDIDCYRGWRRLDTCLPDEALGNGGPMQHRGITHWWAWPTLTALTLTHVPTGAIGWIPTALLIGWTSHLIGDLIFGRNRGIPLAPWWWHIGLGLDTGGPTEALARWTVLPAAVAWLATITAGAPADWPVAVAGHLAAAWTTGHP